MKNTIKRLLAIGIAITTVFTSVPDVVYAKESASKQIEAEDSIEEELEEVESEENSAEGDVTKNSADAVEAEKETEDESVEEKDEEFDSTKVDDVEDKDNKILEKKVVEKEEIEEVEENLQDDSGEEDEELELIYEDLESEEDVEIFPTNYIDLPEDGNFESYGDVVGEESLEATLPSNYTSPNLPNTRNQGSYGTCWAHAAMAVAEIGQGTKPDYSEVHLAYFSYHTPKDPLGGTYGDSNKTGSTSANAYLNGGGNLNLASRILSSWIGPADESVAPYSNATKALSENVAYQDELHLKNAYKANPRTDIAGVKNLIHQYGAAGVSYYALQSGESVLINGTQRVYFSDVYSSANNCYCFPINIDGTNHAVTIVGWDDDFSRDKFVHKPSDDGAWLIRNSWTTDNSERYEGYFWLSYYDGSLGNLAISFEFESADDYDNNYQYDGTMTAPAWYYPQSKCANVFEAKAGEYGESLEAVAFESDYADVNYTVKVYTGVSAGDPESGNLATELSGTTTYAGYYVVPLTSSIELEEGDRFSVVVDMANGTVGVEGTYRSNDFNSVAHIDSNQSYYWDDWNGVWVDNVKNKTGYEGNFRIKAFTNNLYDPTALNIKFDANGGKCDVSSKKVSIYDTFGELPIPEWNEHVFEGWFTDIDGGEEITEDMPVEDPGRITLYAHWSIKKYAITFDANNGEISDDDSVRYIARNECYGELPTPERAGYTFTGWYTGLTNGTKIKAADKLLKSQDQIFYAHWNVNEYVVTFDAMGGICGVANRRYKYDSLYENLPMPTRSGYDFAGWYTSKDGDDEVTSSDAVNIAYNHTLYAHWIPKSYSITLDANGGEGLPESNFEVEIGEKLTKLSSYSLRKDHYTFTGWSTKKVSTSKEDIVTADSSCTGYMKLYAQWKPDEYVITYDVSVDALDLSEHNDSIVNAIDGTTKKVKYGEKIGTLAQPEIPKKATAEEGALNYTFAGWFTKVSGGDRVTESTYLDDNQTIYAHWTAVAGKVASEDLVGEDLDAETEIPTELWVAGIPASVDYIGTAITFPDMRVYWGKNHLLSNGTDYTVKYANNLKAGTATITITGKGNYSGMIVKTFEIEKLPLGEGEAYDIASNNVDQIINNELLIAPDIAVTGNNKLQKGTTTVSYKVNGKYVTLKSGTDYTLIYPNTDKKDTDKYDASAFTADGDYDVIIVGKGNYEGSAKYTQTIRDSKELKLVSKLTVAKIPSQAATGNEVEPGEQVVVKDGTVVLTEGIDYKLSYLNNVLPGTASVIIEGTGDKYIGSKVVTFAITGKPISKVVVSGLPSSIDYSGEAIDFEDEIKADSIKLTYQANKNADVETLSYNEDFTVSYQNNVNAGKNKATIIFTGIGEYTGTLKKTYTINQKKLALEDVITMKNIEPEDVHIGTDAVEVDKQYPYQKGGVKPQPVLKFNDNTLVEGKDYTLRYANNTAVNNGSDARKIPTVTITGKGNYTGSVAVHFTIEGSSLDATSMTASDVTYAAKANICKPAITVVDANGAKLVAGTDYDRNVVYKYVESTTVQLVDPKTKKPTGETETREACDDVEIIDIIPAGTEIEATVNGIGNYAGSTQSETFRIVATNISSATVKIPDQTYTGSAIIIEQIDEYGDIIPDKLIAGVVATAKVGKTVIPLTCGTDFVIDRNSYVNNIAKGTAKVTIKGIGSYGGTKTVTFKIVAKSMSYEIVYDANDAYMNEEYVDKNGINIQTATGTMKTSYTASGAKLPSNTYKRNGFTFIGWNTKADGTGESYGNQGVFKLGSSLNKLKVAIFGNKVTLYAQWTPAVYKITYNGVVVGKNGVISNTNPSTYTIDEGVAALANPVREGYTFDGWYSDSKFKNKVTSIEKGRYGNIVLYPKWIKDPTP